MTKMRRSKGGRVRRLVGSAEAVGPREALAWWEWVVMWGDKKVASGTAQTRRQAIRQIDQGLREVLKALECYCILEDGDRSESTEYVRVVDLFIPDQK